jgi:hypothetical protein
LKTKVDNDHQNKFDYYLNKLNERKEISKEKISLQQEKLEAARLRGIELKENLFSKIKQTDDLDDNKKSIENSLIKAIDDEKDLKENISNIKIDFRGKKVEFQGKCQSLAIINNSVLSFIDHINDTKEKIKI